MLRIAEIHRSDICFTGEGGRVRKYALAGQQQRPQESPHLRSTRSPLFWTALEAALCVYTSGRIGNLMFGGYFRSAPALCLLSPALFAIREMGSTTAVSRCLSLSLGCAECYLGGTASLWHLSGEPKGVYHQTYPSLGKRHF